MRKEDNVCENAVPETERAAEADYAVDGNRMEIRIPRSLLGEFGKSLNIEFKWSDNMQEEGNIMDFYVNGDAAPGGRFNFVYDERAGQNR